MDDVDRLYECFKCGFTPPQSAVKGRKAFRSKVKEDSSTHVVSSLSSWPSLGSSKQSHQNEADIRLCTEKLGSTTFKTSKFNGADRISPIVFYGSPQGVPAKRPSRLWRLLHEIRDDLTEQNEFYSRREVWATFPKQDEAMKFAKGYEHVRLFSYQDHLNGQRRFLVSKYKEFWQRYKNMDSKFRHHYEVIQEGLPCHLYFDLEFNKKENAEKNGDEMVNILISVTFEALFEKYSIQGSKDWIVELDSSTEAKFSRHLIIRIPETAFKDNSHAGAFVAEICSRIVHSRENNRRHENLFVSKGSSSIEPSYQLFVDTAVYSRNRCFRLALSSKAGKNSVLLPTGRFKCKNMSDEEMFMESLICRMDFNCKKLLICKMDLECLKTLHFDSEVDSNYGQLSNGPQEFPFNAHTNDMPKTYFMGKSPFPALDVFVESVASIGNVSGKIRSWFWFSDYGLMVYSMSRNRYCERIGRQHKSNHVMYIVDLRRMVYYQKCYDPDCKGYRSPLRPIPMDVILDPTAVFNSIQIGHHGGVIDNNLENQGGENGWESISCFYDKSITDSCKKDGWWLEAIKIADNAENMRKIQDFGNMEEADDEDSEWWMAVERTASQAEQEASSAWCNQ